MENKDNAEIKFESIIQTLMGVTQEPVLAITLIRTENNMTYFHCLGHDFQTFGDKIIHSKSQLFDSPYIKYLSSSENDPEGIAKHKADMEEVEKESNQWTKHKNAILKFVMIEALKILQKQGDEAFVKYLDQFFFITPEELSKEIMEKLEE